MAYGIDQVLADFILESQENLDRLDHEFIALEHEPNDSELLAGIFRTIHTIKGSAGFLNLTNLEQVSHYAEEVLAKLREHSLQLTTQIITTLLEAVDTIRILLVNLEKTGEEGELDVLEIVMELRSLAASEQQRESSALSAEEPEPSTSSPPELQTEQENADASASLNSSSLTVEDSRIHVDVHLLNRLMNQTGELVLSRNQVVQYAHTVEQRNFRAMVQRMNVVVSELQEVVMKTRMQPVNKVFGMYPRLVRDMSKLQGKDVSLILEGQNTELDRTLLESIKDPLTHLVRNALDHGIELPDIRRNLGKPATATLSIKAYHEGGQVVIEVSDDGRGINLEKIKHIAVRERVVTPQQAEEMSKSSLMHLIFRAGFSTAETVTSLSGRGVGMDVVKRNLDKIGGVIDLNSEEGQGTTINLRIPITLAIIPVLIVQSGLQRFAIPQVHLEELVMIQPEDREKRIEEIHGAEVCRLRGELLPLLRLNRLLKLPVVRDEITENIHIIVVSSGELRFGLIVDNIGDTEEIVIKPLSRHIKQLHCYDGATIMGDGKVALILNIAGLFRTTQMTLETIKKIEASVQGKHQDALAGAEKHHHRRQTIVLFKMGTDEYYGVPMSFVLRLETLSAARIESSGGREVLQYRNAILPLLRLDSYLDLSPVPVSETLSLIVFAVEHQIGLIVHKILDTVEISAQLDTSTFKQPGVLGSAIFDGHAVLILDVHGLIKKAQPSWYSKISTRQLSQEERQETQILLVEDSSFFLNVEKSYLEAAGYQVVTAEHGEEALEKLEQQTVDVVITDIDMPRCNGYELTRRIKAQEQWRDIPVMALTALSGEQERAKGLQAGIDEYQIKLDRDEVLNVLELLILRKQG